MNKTITILTILIFCNTLSFGQTTFEKRWGGEGYEDGTTISKTSDGGFAIAGAATTDSTGFTDIFIMKMDSTGDSLWTKYYGTSPGNDFPSFITETQDGGLLISATTYSLSSGAPTTSDWWIIRTDSMGDTLWTKMIRKTGNDRMFYINENTDRSIICCGWMSTSGWARGTMMKLSETGDSLWSVQIGSSGNSYAQICKENYDGNYLLAGASLSGTFYGYIGEYDTSGTFINYHSYDKTVTAEVINSVDVLPQGGYLISAKTGTTSGGFDIWLIRTNDLWDTLWTKTFIDPVSMNNIEERFAFDVVGDSGCIFGGMKFGPVDMQASIYRVDSAGAIQWTRFFGYAGDDKADEVIALNDGFIFSGYAGLVSNDSVDCYIVRTDVNGMTSVISAIDELTGRDDVTIFPNPAKGFIQWKSNMNPVNEIRFFSISGQLIHSVIPDSNERTIDVDFLSNGIYIVEFISDESVVKKRIVIERD